MSYIFNKISYIIDDLECGEANKRYSAIYELMLLRKRYMMISHGNRTGSYREKHYPFMFLEVNRVLSRLDDDDLAGAVEMLREFQESVIYSTSIIYHDMGSNWYKFIEWKQKRNYESS